MMGRMSFQVPGGMVIMGAMVTFYKTVPQVVFWQWVNQSFNALVNYTNRNADSDVSVSRLGAAYVSATASALGVALGLNKYLERSAPPIFRRFVPLLAVAAANCVRSCTTGGFHLNQNRKWKFHFATRSSRIQYQ